MWRRIRRVVEANLGRLRDDPLAPAADLAALAAQLEAVRGQIALLERDLARCEADEETLGGAIRTELAAGRRDAGLELAKRLGDVREERARLQRQLEVAQRACARAEAVSQAHRAQPAPGDTELQAAADDTLARLERDLAGEGSAGTGKTLGVPGPEPVAEPAAPTEPKTIGGSRDRAATTDPGARPARKTIGPAESPPPAAGRQGDPIGELERLARLRESGALTAEEFLQAKQRLLGGDATSL